MKAYLKISMIVAVLLAGCHSDVVTKHLATQSLKDQPAVPVISGYLDLNYTENEGIAFSMFGSLTPEVRRPILAGLQMLSTLVILGLIVVWRKKSFFVLLPFALFVSGGLGNLIDRLRYGYVVDFIHFHIEDRFSWPVFNVADILISVGIGLLILQMLFRKENPLSPAQ
jgi:signal peptidase II